MSHFCNHERAAAIFSATAHRPQTLLPLLPGIQDAFTHISLECIAQVASVLNLSCAKVHDVAFR
jgi:NADH:ubiquinone oxidoreductase subunit E